MAEMTQFSGWAIVDQMGHTRLAGYVTVEEIASQAMLRVEIPEGPGQGTRFVHPQSLFAITPTTEEVARAMARRSSPPVEPWLLREERPIPVLALRDDVPNGVRTCIDCGAPVSECECS